MRGRRNGSRAGCLVRAARIQSEERSAPGHGIGYEHTFVHTVADFVNACADGKPVHPTFEDGLKNQRVLTAVEESHHKGKWIKL